MSSTEDRFSAMDENELNNLRERSLRLLEEAIREVKKLKKKFSSNRYDRQVICEYLLDSQRQISDLNSTISKVEAALQRMPALQN